MVDYLRRFSLVPRPSPSRSIISPLVMRSSAHAHGSDEPFQFHDQISVFRFPALSLALAQ